MNRPIARPAGVPAACSSLWAREALTAEDAPLLEVARVAAETHTTRCHGRRWQADSVALAGIHHQIHGFLRGILLFGYPHDLGRSEILRHGLVSIVGQTERPADNLWEGLGQGRSLLEFFWLDQLPVAPHGLLRRLFNGTRDPHQLTGGLQFRCGDHVGRRWQNGWLCRGESERRNLRSLAVDGATFATTLAAAFKVGGPAVGGPVVSRRGITVAACEAYALPPLLLLSSFR